MEGSIPSVEVAPTPVLGHDGQTGPKQLPFGTFQRDIKKKKCPSEAFLPCGDFDKRLAKTEERLAKSLELTKTIDKFLKRLPASRRNSLS
jgi:hypothetical protein